MCPREETDNSNTQHLLQYMLAISESLVVQISRAQKALKGLLTIPVTLILLRLQNEEEMSSLKATESKMIIVTPLPLGWIQRMEGEHV